MPSSSAAKNAEQWKIEGNRLMKANFLEAAKLAYENGIASHAHNQKDSPHSNGQDIDCNNANNESILQALHSNLSLVYQKLELWEKAVIHASRAIEVDISSSAPSTVAVKAKVLYRRGICQETLAFLDCASGGFDRKINYMNKAKVDLEECISILNTMGVDDDHDNSVKKVTLIQQLKPAKSALYRINNRLNSIVLNFVDGKGNEVLHSDTRKSSSRKGFLPLQIPDLLRQRQTVEVLLEQSLQPHEGEAFYLIDYKWWKQWCEYVSFKKFNLLPIGGTAISKELFKALEIHFNDSDDDSSTSSNEKINESKEIPEKLDTCSLLENSDDEHQRLKPGLVRGYHYEIVPREVYFTLRSWYGEDGMRIIRRARIKDGILKVKLYTNNPRSDDRRKQKFDDTLRCSACRLPSSQKCKKCQSTYYCSIACQQNHWPYHRVICQRLKTTQTHNPLRLKLEDFGRCGLGNLGNTCFMNSSLQCLSHAYPLTRYFLTNNFINDINYSNPLGTKGNLARAYDTTLKDLYWSNKTSINPSQLKRSIALFQPRFSGYSQEDAPEFLAYLLDGLHEDLNRIEKKPYITLPDAETGYENIQIAGAEARAADRMRNHSVLRDNFYGQYQSTCVCPNCNQVSVTFDPFNILNVHLPNEMTKIIHILYFQPNNGYDWGVPPIRYGISVNYMASNIEDVKIKLSSLCSVPFQDLTLCDVYEHRICKILSDMSEGVANIQNNDFIVAYNINSDQEDTVQIVVTHQLLIEHKNENNDLHPFGLPYFVAFEPSKTCHFVREHIWAQFRRYLHENKYLDSSMLKIRVVDNKYRHVVIDASKANTSEGSIFPNTSDTLQDVFGNDCTDCYLFLNIEWSDASLLKHLRKESVSDMVIHQSVNTPKGLSLEQCIDNFTKPERLDESNMYYCSKCKQHVRAMKTMKLCQLPNILIIHLKRFEFKSSFRRNKLETFVDCPLNGLNLSKVCQSESSDSNLVCGDISAIYDLFGVTNHYGRMGFGHYTACCRQWDNEEMSKEWTLFDDSHTTDIDEKSVVTSSAYMLFYRRRIFT